MPTITDRWTLQEQDELEVYSPYLKTCWLLLYSAVYSQSKEISMFQLNSNTTNQLSATKPGIGHSKSCTLQVHVHCIQIFRYSTCICPVSRPKLQVVLFDTSVDEPKMNFVYSETLAVHI